jgi:hypothetical protein
VHAILMDLAMPGIDGWETIRSLRRLDLSAAPVAIVSANAFDKGLDNDVGIMPEDFITKPVRLDELLDWLGRQLGLQWLATPPSPPTSAALPVDSPPRARNCSCATWWTWATVACTSCWTRSKPSSHTAPCGWPPCGAWPTALSSTA